jgi:predicted transcriptional regulator
MPVQHLGALAHLFLSSRSRRQAAAAGYGFEFFRWRCYLQKMDIRLPPDQEARLAELAARAGRTPGEVVQEALALWQARQIPQGNVGCSPAAAAARIRELRKGNALPEGETIKDIIDYGRA